MRTQGDSENLGLAVSRQAPNRKRVQKVEKPTGSIRGVCILAAVVAVLALAPAASAQSTGTGYGGVAGGTAGQVQGGSGGNQGVASPNVASEAAEADSSGLLAFTGLDVAL